MQTLDDNGDVDPDSYRAFKKMRRRKAATAVDYVLDLLMKEAKEESEKATRKRRSCRSNPLKFLCPVTGEIVPLTWHRSSWYLLYVDPLGAEARKTTNSSRHSGEGSDFLTMHSWT
mmetsp:Transcript_22844/g.49845  ORF Transcript_22844/g.49845 Transcript_22844/m.49845 type:complete len:116 (+) Transcript_22844:2286-2633(+)